MMGKTEMYAYTAGILDGEGCIYLHPPNKTMKAMYLMVSVANTSAWLCEWLKVQYGGRVYNKPRAKATHSKCYQWEIYSRQAGEFLNLIFPYLSLKRPQAELAIKFQEARRYGRRLSDEEKAVQEAQKILISHLNN